MLTKLATLAAVLIFVTPNVWGHGQGKCLNVSDGDKVVSHFAPNGSGDPCVAGGCTDTDYNGGHGHKTQDLMFGNESWTYWTRDGYNLRPDEDIDYKDCPSSQTSSLSLRFIPSSENSPQSSNLVAQSAEATDSQESSPEETDSGESPPEDVDGDGDVDNDDLLAIVMNLGKTPEGDLARYDLDGDGDIDSNDVYVAFLVMDGQSGNAAPAALHTPQMWFQQRIVEIENPEGTVRIVIPLPLPEKQLMAPIPKKTVLLANYPNPFNPETWIPYRLAKAADVTLTIYDGRGQVVRTLALGHQPVGSYIDRARAAYWDGKNAFGETVASGVYFYHLSTGDYSATRRMMILK